jgi:hypothetical protein
MLNTPNTSLSRRAVLKAGALTTIFLALPALSTKVLAQASNAIAEKMAGPKPNGLISFNAGWMIPAEDQKALLLLEEKKIKEAQASSAQVSQSTDASADGAKPTKKIWTEKLQDTWKKVKNYF